MSSSFGCGTAVGSILLVRTILGAQVDSSPLKLEAEILRVDYCRADADVGFMKLYVKLTFRNVQSEPILLHKGAGITDGVLMSKTMSDLQAGRYEHEYSSTTLVAESAHPPSAFVALGKNEVYEKTTQVRLPIVLSSNTAMTFGVAPGEHVLSLVVSTWPNQSASPDKVRASNKDKRKIFFSTLRSQPLLIQVARVSPIESCSTP